jgi:hypothetical protein
MDIGSKADFQIGLRPRGSKRRERIGRKRHEAGGSEFKKRSS